MDTLSLTVDQARNVLRASEGKPGPDGVGDKGHTLERHVEIRNLDLEGRVQKEMKKTKATHPRSRQMLLYTAFKDIGQCATALSKAVAALGAHEFVRDFGKLPHGARLDTDTTRGAFPPLLPEEIELRYFGGTNRIKLQQFALKAVKMSGRPHDLHVITFYMRIEGLE
jgi:hypothetical protein